MSSYGISIFSINEEYACLSKQRSGRVNFSSGQATITCSLGEMIVITESNGYIALSEINNNIATLISDDATYTEYMVISANIPKLSSEYGIEVYNQKGNVVFSSNYFPIKPIKTINTAINKGYFAESIIAGKRCGILLGNMGFGIYLSKREHYISYRAVRVSSNKIEFGFAKYHLQAGDGWLDAYLDTSSALYSALLVDVTGG